MDTQKQALLDILSNNNNNLVFSENDKKTIDKAFDKKGIYKVITNSTIEIVKYSMLHMTIATLKTIIKEKKKDNWKFKVIYTISDGNIVLYLDLDGILVEVQGITDSSEKNIDLKKTLSDFLTEVGKPLSPQTSTTGVGGAPNSQQPIFMSIMNANRQVMKDKKGVYVTIDNKRQYLRDMKEYTVFSTRII